MLRGPEARTHRICWLAISMMWPMPITIEPTSRPAGDDHSAKLAQASAKIAAPTQLVSASRPVSRKRPIRTAIMMGKMAKVAAIRPRNTIERFSSTAR